MNDRSVLVVEDETIVAFDIRKSLERLGYEVPGCAASGEKAVDLARQLKPDLVLMDISLAGKMTGLEAAREIRASSNPHIVFLSAFDDPQTLDRMKEAKMTDYITKPFEEFELKQTLARIFAA